ncbi:MAG: alpha/beta fold hydrolase [Myxococcota bacterium]
MKVDPGPFRLGDVGGRGPAVLCLHGLTGTPYEVRPPAEALAAEGFACLGPLLPGHGTRPEDLAEVHRDAWIDAVVESWDELAATHSRVYTVGLSMGGVLALALSARRAVPGAVVMAAPLQLSPLVRTGVPLLRRFLRFLPKRPAILDDAARERHPGYDRMPLAAVHQLIQLGQEVSRDLARITHPLKLIYSRRDPSVHTSNAERVLSGVSSQESSVSFLHDSGHVLPVDRERAVVASQVVEFVTRLEERSPVDGSRLPGEF